jgi:hypothetical protein
MSCTSFKSFFWHTELFLKLNVAFFAGSLGGMLYGVVDIILYYSHLWSILKIVYPVPEIDLDW